MNQVPCLKTFPQIWRSMPRLPPTHTSHHGHASKSLLPVLALLHSPSSDHCAHYLLTPGSFDETLNVYVGDCYSVNWLEDSDAIDLKKESLEDQYEIVKKKTEKSEVSCTTSAIHRCLCGHLIPMHVYVCFCRCVNMGSFHWIQSLFLLSRKEAG